MAKAERTEVFDVDCKKLYTAITDYKSYPSFVDGMKSVEVLSQSATGASVKFNLNLIKEVTYTLELKHNENKEVSWTLKSGDLMKVNNGGWKLKDLGNGKQKSLTTSKWSSKDFFRVWAWLKKRWWPRIFP